MNRWGTEQNSLLEIDSFLVLCLFIFIEGKKSFRQHSFQRKAGFDVHVLWAALFLEAGL